MILTKDDNCPKGIVLQPGSVKCRLCEHFIGKKYTVVLAKESIFCKQVTKDYEVKLYLDNSTPF